MILVKGKDRTLSRQDSAAKKINFGYSIIVEANAERKGSVHAPPPKDYDKAIDTLTKRLQADLALIHATPKNDTFPGLGCHNEDRDKETPNGNGSEWLWLGMLILCGFALVVFMNTI